MYILYILRNIHDRLYIGQTNNLERRLNEHKTHRGAKFIKDYGVFQLVYTEQFDTRIDAMQREKQLKRWTIAKKEALISGDLELLKRL
ncbi:MAG: GIY-YIG nuclease family protein [Candidatus Saccharimonadales bacterium]